MTEVNQAVHEEEEKVPGIFGKTGAVAQAYGLFNTASAAGQLIGPLLAGLLVDRAGWGTMGLVLGLISIVAAVPVGLWVGK